MKEEIGKQKREKPSTPPSQTAAAESDTILIEISDDEDDKEQEALSQIQIEKVETLSLSNKVTPPLIKLAKPSFSNNNKILSSQLLPNTSLLKAQKKDLLKVPCNSILKKPTSSRKRVVLALKDNTGQPDIIKRLKMNSGLQVSVLDDEAETPANMKESTTVSSSGSPMQVQTCEIVTVREHNGVKTVALKRRIPVQELHNLIKKQIVAVNVKSNTESTQ